MNPCADCHQDDTPANPVDGVEIRVNGVTQVRFDRLCRACRIEKLAAYVDTHRCPAAAATTATS